MSAFNRMARRVKDSRFVIPITLVVLLGIVVGCFAFYEDYRSSYEGYRMLPTRKSGVEVIQMIALLPQVGQIIFFYMFGSTAERSEKTGRWKYNMVYFIVAGFLLLFDLGTDMYFKAFGLPPYVWGIAFVESITVFTIGSEVLLTGSIGIFIELVPIALKQLGSIFADLFGEDEDEPVRSRH